MRDDHSVRCVEIMFVCNDSPIRVEWCLVKEDDPVLTADFLTKYEKSVIRYTAEAECDDVDSVLGELKQPGRAVKYAELCPVDCASMRLPEGVVVVRRLMRCVTP